MIEAGISEGVMKCSFLGIPNPEIEAARAD